MTPIYAIGDIHGQKAELDRVLSLIEADGGRDADVVFLGDYTDRGPDSRAVLDTLIEGRDAGRNWTFLKGNHDRMFEWFMADPIRHDPYMMVELYWLHDRLGGNTTLASYGVDASGMRREKDVQADARAAVPQSHLDFLRDLHLNHIVGNLMFVHAGIRPGVALELQTEEDMLWIRQEFHHCTDPHPKLIVHGHTPVDAATHCGNRINLDTGAGYGRPLTAAVFEDDTVWLLTDTGRLPLTP
ncbi:serine/threonine protein phosphatase [Tateyamaria omphalii]|uniref:metallophosphoesterase family protein n=1 Tax=Tateyamaria omphalii TaxID=299262 RepID=UPI001678E073|nr:metallophosphoesterase family protein [Tateyamaria omphalii]GGX39501.1 serine/threonine protein phosphatase [Tateyamaria omphalii]